MKARIKENWLSTDVDMRSSNVPDILKTSEWKKKHFRPQNPFRIVCSCIQQI